jgi:hypothetical protein
MNFPIQAHKLDRPNHQSPLFRVVEDPSNPQHRSGVGAEDLTDRQNTDCEHQNIDLEAELRRDYFGEK